MDIERMIGGIETGRYPAGVYSDAGVFELERTQVFAHTWQFLAHESEIPRPGDYVVRRILDDPFIVVRGDDGQVRALLNMCRHRGMQVCRADAGNVSYFRCPYHAWSYKNTGSLAGVPFLADAYGGEAEFSKEEFSLIPAPRLESYRGLLFACLDPGVASLEESIGDFAFFLDLYVNQSEGGIELQGPQRWIVRSNWKIGAENFAGDSYHTPHTHASVVEIDLFHEPRASKRKNGALYWAGSGGGTTYKLPSNEFDENLRYIGYPDQMIERMRQRWLPEQRALVGRAGFMVSASTLFPNLSLVHNWPKVSDGDEVTPFISLRLWRPVSPTETEVSSWFVVDANAPEWYKERSRRAYLLCFGSSGMFEQDDVENWTSITSGSAGYLGAQVSLNSTMGMSSDGGTIRQPVEDWPGPGQAFTGYGEYNQRKWLSMWSGHLRNGTATNGRPPDGTRYETRGSGIPR